MRKYLAAVAVLAFTLPTLAHADWAWTTWSMSADQVVAASKGQVRAVQGTEGDRVHGFDLKAQGKASQDGFDFDAEFFFDSDGARLHVVRLIPDESRCPALRDLLKSRYGEPRDDSRTFPMGGGRTLTLTALKWSDPAHGNFVAYTYTPAVGEMAAGCFVRYRPIAEADPPAT
jgi:hypothetical protein